MTFRLSAREGPARTHPPRGPLPDETRRPAGYASIARITPHRCLQEANLLIHAGVFTLGVVLLFTGAESLVRGASDLSRYFRVHPLIVGLTVVAFGTSAPELVVTLMAALRGSTDISLGNVVGSNIANVGLVLGLAALIRPLSVGRKTLRQEAPVMVLSQAVFLLMAIHDLRLGRFDGLFLLAAMVSFSLLMLHRTFSDRIEASLSRPCAREPAALCLSKNGGKIILGIAGLIVGSNLMIDSGSAIALALGVSKWVIGTTLVAVGTSLPELATSLVAAYRDEPDICVGNVVGSNIFNVLLIVGTVSVVHPLPVPRSIIYFELPTMFLFSLLAFAVMANGRRVSRPEGLLLLAFYGLFLWRLP